MSDHKRRGLIITILFFAACGVTIAAANSDSPVPTNHWWLPTLAVSLAAVAVTFTLTIAEAFAFAASQNKVTNRVRNLSRGLCPTCGYDIRENSDRCSECGEALPEKLSTDSQTPAVRRIIQAAVAEAKQRRSEYVGSEHVLLALFNDRENTAVVALQNLGVEESAVRREVSRLLPADRVIGSSNFVRR